MEPFRHHIFVCTQEKPAGVDSCPANRSLSVLETLEHEVLAQGIDPDVQISTCGCLGLCDDGPILIVYPEGIWYRWVQTGDVAEIVSSHLRANRPVSRLEWEDGPAMKKLSTEHREHYREMVKAKTNAGKL